MIPVSSFSMAFFAQRTAPRQAMREGASMR
jgi:hypothetical protein